MNPLLYDPKLVVQFLYCQNSFSYNHLNAMRSAIGSVWKELYPQQPLIGKDRLVQSFFAAKRRSEKRLPNTSQETYDVNVILTLVHSWGTNEEMSLTRLQRKTLSLLAIATMWRPRSDLGNLQFRDIKFLYKGEDLQGVTLIAREPKEGMAKTSKIGVTDLGDMCPVRTLMTFGLRTTEARKTLPEDHKLFLTYLDQEAKSGSASPKTSRTAAASSSCARRVATSWPSAKT